MGERDWLSAHLFYQGDQDVLLLDLVRPLVAELAAEGLAGAAFFLRYWDGGSHLRLRVLPDNRQAFRDARRLIAERCRRYLRQHPSDDRTTEQEYAVTAARLARWEGVDRYAERMYPNNSVAFIPYRREHDRYGHGRSIEAAERHFVDSSRIALAVLASHRDRTHKAATGYAMLLAAWLLCVRDPADLRSHAEATLQRRFVAGAGRVETEERCRRERDRLLAGAERLRLAVALAERGRDAGALTAWAQSLARLRDALLTSGAAGRALPVIDLCAHLACNRLGLGPDQESELRAVAAWTVIAKLQQGGGSWSGAASTSTTTPTRTT